MDFKHSLSLEGYTSPYMATLKDTLQKQGYAPAAIDAFIISAVAPTNGDEQIIEAHFNAIASNYYMQYLSLQLEQYGFDLNRPNIPAQQLSRADNLIKGKLGNTPLDSPYVVNFLERWVIHMRKKHVATPINWNDLHDYTYTSPDGVSLPGSELVKALIRSDRIYGTERAIHYRHRYNGMNFRTISMNELMAHVLPEVPHHDLADINRYGREVKLIAVDHVRNVLRMITNLKQPRLDRFFEINTHHRIMQCIQKLNFAINNDPVDLSEICKLYEFFRAERYTRHVYPDDWQRFIGELESGLESIATPYREEDVVLNPNHDSSAPETHTPN